MAVEYQEPAAIELLLSRHADLNAPAQVGVNGVGGHTPLYHAIGTNSGTGFPVFRELMKLGPDLSTRAHIQVNPAHNDLVMDCIYKGRDHFFDEMLTLTPRGGHSA